MNAAVTVPKEEPRGEEQDAGEDVEQDLEKVWGALCRSRAGGGASPPPGPTERAAAASCRCAYGILLPHGSVGCDSHRSMGLT